VKILSKDIDKAQSKMTKTLTNFRSISQNFMSPENSKVYDYGTPNKNTSLDLD
jgi:hypothetical protein